MRRGAERVRRRVLAGLVLAALAGCVTVPPAPVLDPPAQREALARLARYTISGRVAVASAGQGFNAGVDWQQDAARSRLKLSGPLGAGSLVLEYGDGTLAVTTSRGEALAGDEAVGAIEQQLGFVPPLAPLRWWLLGLPAPDGGPSEAQQDADGRTIGLAQDGWTLRYERFMAVKTRAGALQLPARVTATRPGTRLRLVVDRWRLP